MNNFTTNGPDRKWRNYSNMFLRETQPASILSPASQVKVSSIVTITTTSPQFNPSWQKNWCRTWPRTVAQRPRREIFTLTRVMRSSTVYSSRLWSMRSTVALSQQNQRDLKMKFSVKSIRSLVSAIILLFRYNKINLWPIYRISKLRGEQSFVSAVISGASPQQSLQFLVGSFWWQFE